MALASHEMAGSKGGPLYGLLARVEAHELAPHRGASELRTFFEPQGSPGLEARLTGYLTELSSLVARAELDIDTAVADLILMTREWRELSADLLGLLDLGIE